MAAVAEPCSVPLTSGRLAASPVHMCSPGSGQSRESVFKTGSHSPVSLQLAAPPPVRSTWRATSEKTAKQCPLLKTKTPCP